jgi:hypothetical protein
MFRSSCVRVASLIVFAGLLNSIAGCAGDARISKANYEKINLGMTLKEVQDILGPGTKQAPQGDGSGVGSQFGVDVTMGGQASTRRGDVYEWESGARKITIHLDMQGKVTNKDAKGF